MSRAGNRLAGVVFGCCLAAAISGCSFHRTAHGFVLRGGHWSLEHNREGPDTSARDASEKPETLPWRSRLKGYRLARVLHGWDSAGEVSASAEAAEDVRVPDRVFPLPEAKRPDLVVE